MTLPTGTISMSQIQAEYGGANPIGLSEYRSKGNAPASGPIAMSQFRGTSATAVLALTTGVHAGAPQDIWGFSSNKVYNMFPFGALAPDAFKGVLCLGVIQIKYPNFELSFQGIQTQTGLFSSIRVVSAGSDKTLLPANATFTTDVPNNSSKWTWGGANMMPSNSLDATVYLT